MTSENEGAEGLEPCFTKQILTRYCHQDIQAFKDIHLLESSSADQRVYLPLATSVQQHQAAFCAHQQIHTCFKDRERPHFTLCSASRRVYGRYAIYLAGQFP